MSTVVWIVIAVVVVVVITIAVIAGRKRRLQHQRTRAEALRESFGRRQRPKWRPRRRPPASWSPALVPDFWYTGSD